MLISYNWVTMLCRSSRHDQILYLFLLFPAVNFSLSVTARADRSLMQSVWNQMFLLPTSPRMTLGQWQKAAAHSLHLINHRAQNTKLACCWCSASCFPTSLQKQVKHTWMCWVSAFLLPPPALCGTPWLLQKALWSCLNGRAARRAGHTAGLSIYKLVSLWILVTKYIWATDSRVGREPLECRAQGAGATFKPIFQHEGRDNGQTTNKRIRDLNYSRFIATEHGLASIQDIWIYATDVASYM